MPKEPQPGEKHTQQSLRDEAEQNLRKAAEAFQTQPNQQNVAEFATNQTGKTMELLSGTCAPNFGKPPSMNSAQPLSPQQWENVRKALEASRQDDQQRDFAQQLRHDAEDKLRTAAEQFRREPTLENLQEVHRTAALLQQYDLATNQVGKTMALLKSLLSLN
jgi:hypothetical protein